MKTTTLFLIIALICCFNVQAHSQSEQDGNDIARLIKNGNSSELAKHFNVTLQLTLPGNEGRYSRTQAELIIREFFSKYPPKSFDISHQGSSSDGSKYYIGVYKSNKTTFRSYFLIRQVSEKALIHQLRFEEDD
jgi:hypothetical protein